MGIYDFSQPSITGEATSLSAFEGKVLLVVNVASKCGLTSQYEGLQALQASHADKGFAVLGFPCNQFGGQEPGSEAEIATFCSTNYGVSFPMFSKLDVNGGERHPLYAWLTAAESAPDGPGDIGWNFAKFIIGRDGEVHARFSPRTAPNDPALVASLEAAFAKNA